MGQLRRVGDVFYIEFYARGLMYSQLAGNDEQQALKMLEQIEAKIAQGEDLTVVREMGLDVFFEKFLVYANERFSPKSIWRFTQMWKHWTGFLKYSYPLVINLSQIIPSIIESYKIELMKSQKSKVVNLTILLLREILEYGIRIGFINDNPTLHISLLKMPIKSVNEGRRFSMAKEVLERNLSLEKISSILKLKDVAGILYWSNFIPLIREDVYN
jgi:hypothetical protein